jgi:hypothetical protein
MWITWKRAGCYLFLVIGYLAVVVGMAERGNPGAKMFGMLFWVWLWYAWKLAGKATS